MEYLLKASAIIIIFYICYKIFLQQETFFESNRRFLLIGLLTTFSIPFLVIPIYTYQTPIILDGYIFDNSVLVTKNTEQSLSIPQIATIIYVLGVALFSIRFIIQLISLATLIFKNEVEKNGRYLFIKTNQKVSPFSFFRWIVYNPNRFNEIELNQIITHEKVHVKQLHSIDVLLIQLSCIALWFNPFIWLYSKKLKQNLEFIADKETAKFNNCKTSYQYTLLKTSLPIQQLTITNNFYNSLIRKRIVMLHKSKSKKINQLKYSLVIPLLAAFLFTFNTETIAQEKEPKLSPWKVSAGVIIDKNTTDAKLNTIQTTFKKDFNMDFTYTLNRNSKNEINSIDITLKDKNGETTWHDKNNKYIKPFEILYNPKLKEMSVRAIKASLNKEKRLGIYQVDKSKEPSLYILNGKEITKEMFENIDPDTIDSISVLKDDNALEKYGEKGKSGVVEIKTKALYKTKINFDNKEPLYLLDGKKITKKEMEAFNTNAIESINVLKGDKAIEKYGKKGKDGVIEIKTKAIDKTKINFDNKGPLYLLDGKEITKKEMDALDTNAIETIDVLKGDKAIEKYGEKAKGGVVMITSKKQ